MYQATERTKVKVIRHWFNGFAQDCYQLSNGSTIYINYGADEVTIETPPKDSKAKAQYMLHQAKQLWLYNGVVKDGYQVVNGEVKKA